MIQPLRTADLGPLLNGRTVLVIRSADTVLFTRAVEAILKHAPDARVSVLVPPWLKASNVLSSLPGLRSIMAGSCDPWGPINRATLPRGLRELQSRRFDFTVVQFEDPLGAGLRGEDRLALAISRRCIVFNARGRFLCIDRAGRRNLMGRRLLARVVLPCLLAAFAAVSFLPALLVERLGLFDPLQPMRAKR